MTASSLRYEIIASPSAPAGGSGSGSSSGGGIDLRSESRVWSLPDLASPMALWWWTVLATNVGDGDGGLPLRLAELYPTPPADALFWY